MQTKKELGQRKINKRKYPECVAETPKDRGKERVRDRED